MVPAHPSAHRRNRYLGHLHNEQRGGSGQTDRERVRESRRRYRWRRPGDLLVCFGSALQTVVSPLSARSLLSQSLPSMSVRRRLWDTCAVSHRSFTALRSRFVSCRKNDFYVFIFATLRNIRPNERILFNALTPPLYFFFSTIARYSFFIHLIQSIALTGINLTRRYTFRGYTFKP